MIGGFCCYVVYLFCLDMICFWYYLELWVCYVVVLLFLIMSNWFFFCCILIYLCIDRFLVLVWFCCCIICFGFCGLNVGLFVIDGCCDDVISSGGVLMIGWFFVVLDVFFWKCFEMWVFCRMVYVWWRSRNCFVGVCVKDLEGWCWSWVWSLLSVWFRVWVELIRI